MKKILFLIFLLLITVALVGCGSTKEDKGASKDAKSEAKAEFVGSEKCKSCHAKIADSMSKTLHTKMVQDVKVNPAVIVGDFTKPGNPFEKATKLKKEDIVYTIGSKWKQRYVWKDGETLRLLPAEWIVKEQKWQPYKADTWENLDYGLTCIGCHTTGYDIEKKAFKELGIGCEACHGKGSLHAIKPSKSNIINPKNLDPKKQTEVCGQCHVRGQEGDNIREDALGFQPGGDDFSKYMKALTPESEASKGEKSAFYPDGASKKHHQQYNDFVQSKHYSANISCINCHDAHAGEITGQLKQKAEDLCFSCHNKGGKAVTKLAEPFDLSQYMPKRAKSGTKNDITIHTFKPDQPK